MVLSTLKQKRGQERERGYSVRKITAQALSEGMAFQDSRDKKEADTQREGVKPF